MLARVDNTKETERQREWVREGALSHHEDKQQGCNYTHTWMNKKKDRGKHTHICIHAHTHTYTDEHTYSHKPDIHRLYRKPAVARVSIPPTVTAIPRFDFRNLHAVRHHTLSSWKSSED